MSVATKNPFALLDDDLVLDDAPQKEEQPPSIPTPARGTAKSRAGGPASRGGKYYNRGGKTQTPKETLAADEPATDNQTKTSNLRGGDRDRERGRGRGRGRGDSGRGRGRPFDRHSQTGKIDSDKKIHQSWGGDDGNTELKTEEAATFDAAAETNNEWGSATVNNDWGGSAETNADGWVSAPDASASAPAEGEPKPEGARGRKDKEAEEEDNTLTLDQYLAQKKEKESVVPKLEGIRKANEGTNEDWKGIVPLAKNEDEESYYVGKAKQATKTRPKKEEKIYIEIDIHFDRPERGGRGRGRGDRGDRGRGGRGRGGGGGGSRGGRWHSNDTSASIDVDNQNDFPSLT